MSSVLTSGSLSSLTSGSLSSPVRALFSFPVYGYVICDHMMALHVYISALNGSCTLTGIPCSTYEDFLKGRCVACGVFNGKCPVIGKVTWVITCSAAAAAAAGFCVVSSCLSAQSRECIFWECHLSFYNKNVSRLEINVTLSYKLY